MIANSVAYNDKGSFEYQQAQKLNALIKKEITRALTAEGRYIREQEKRDEFERREECTVVLDEIIGLVIKVEEKRLIRVDRERKRLLHRQQVLHTCFASSFVEKSSNACYPSSSLLDGHRILL